VLAGLPFEILVLTLILGLVLLAKGADWFVEAASGIAERFNLSKLVIGLTVVAIGTSAPEFAVSAYAAFNDSGNLAVANVVGSNIFNLGFILALCAIAAPITIAKETVYRDCTFLGLGTILLSGFVLHDGAISRVEGIVLAGLLVGYIAYLIKNSRSTKLSVSQASQSISTAKPKVAKSSQLKDIGILVVGLLTLLLGCNLAVDSAKIIATGLGVSEWMIGITVIAIGTSLPELVTAIASVAKGNSEIGVGGLIGSDIFNIFGVIGMSAMLSPMTISSGLSMPFYFLIFTTLLTGILMRTRWQLSRREGIFLFTLAGARYALEILL
jgi:cation:H+ antiporter